MMRLRQTGILIPYPERRLAGAGHFLTNYTSGSDFVTNSGNSISLSTATTAGGTAHTKGSWAQVIAATTSDVYALEITPTTDIFVSAANSAALLDVGVGAAAAEVVVIPNINVGYMVRGNTYEFPIFIPSGSRIALRTQSITTSKSITFALRAKSTRHGLKPAKYCTTYGASTANSRGTALSTAAINVEGAWTELTSATTERLGGIVACSGGAGGTNQASATVVIDIGIGGAGSEVVIVQNITGSYTSIEQYSMDGANRPLAVNIPSGTRIAARVATASTSNAVDLLLVGIPWRP